MDVIIGNDSWPFCNFSLLTNSSVASCNEAEYRENYLILVSKLLLLSLIVILTISGNTLVLLAVFLCPNLRSPTHLLIVNLAVADLLLGFTVLPFSVTLEVTGKWYFGHVFCSVWAAVDVLCCTASILSLCVISVDRYIGVNRPLNYSSIMGKKLACVLMCAIWILSLAISIGPLLGWREPPSSDPYECTVTKQLGYVLFSVTGSFYLPMLVIIILYWKIYKAAVRQTKFLECGIKTTKSEVTLRVHMGGGFKAMSESTGDLAMRFVNTRCKEDTNIKPSAQDGVQETSISTSRTDTCNKRSQDTSTAVSATDLAAGVHCEHQQPSSSHLSSPVSYHSPERRFTSAGFSGKLAKFRRQKKAAKTLGIVVGVFLLCWFPFFLILPLDALCMTCNISEPVFAIFFWLGYCNSFLNPMIYACTSRDFKRAFQRILCRKRQSNRNSKSTQQTSQQQQQAQQQQQGHPTPPKTQWASFLWKLKPTDSTASQRNFNNNGLGVATTSLSRNASLYWR